MIKYIIGWIINWSLNSTFNLHRHIIFMNWFSSKINRYLFYKIHKLINMMISAFTSFELQYTEKRQILLLFFFLLFNFHRHLNPI